MGVDLVLCIGLTQVYPRTELRHRVQYVVALGLHMDARRPGLTPPTASMYPLAIEAMSSSDRMGYRGQPSYGAPTSTSTSGGGMKSFFNLLVLGFIGYVLYHIFFAAPNTAYGAH